MQNVVSCMDMTTSRIVVLGKANKYFRRLPGIPLAYSALLFCINVGKEKIRKSSWTELLDCFQCHVNIWDFPKRKDRACLYVLASTL